ncbi:MAG: regulatory protein RecX [Candidatus Kaelpia aquatica]|nr:regulatory protein RecX [Candidatus Kaelpia aquatica]
MDSFRYAQMLLKYRPRSEEEIKERLSLRGYDSESIKEVVEKLKQCDFINDLEFAKYWMRYRLSSNLRSKFFTVLELKRKGVSKEIIESVLRDFDIVNEKDIVFSLAEKKVKSMNKIKDSLTRRRRLYAYLGRRGFGSSISREAVNSVLSD